jgi:hypothetical protein
MEYAYLSDQQQQDILTNRLRDLESQHFSTSLQVTQVESRPDVDNAGLEGLKTQLGAIEDEYAAVVKLLKEVGGEVPKAEKAGRATKA